jgi:hypothetical protein
MKKYTPVILLVIIAMLGCALGYEIVQKNSIGKETAKSWHRFVLTQSVQNYQDLARGDVESVKGTLMVLAKVEAEDYVTKYGRETGTKFAACLSKANEIYNEYQATNRPSK